MNNDKAQGVRGEVLSILVNSPTTEEIRKSVISETQRASLRHGSTAGTQYDQVSSGEMLRRFREQSLLQRKQSNAVAMETVQDTAHKVVETSRSEDYVIEVPKSGLFDRDEYLIPLYLPTGCSPDQKETTDNSEIDAQKLSVDELAKAAARPIRTLVYCEDDVLFTEYLQEHNLYGASKPLWGLQFDSKFECGNLYKAESVQHRGAPLGAPEEYELTIRPDIYNPSNNSNLTTSKSDSAATAAADSEVGRASLAGGSQWYFFRVMNTKKRTYRFHIGPFSHDVPALRRGMRPVMISEQAYKQEGMGWQRVGQNVIFERNRVTGAYTLSFTFTNEIAKDVLYFAFAPPYTYTQLQNMLYTLAKDDSVRQHFSVRPLCRTLGGNRCDVVTIAENITPARSLAPPESASGFSGSGNAADNTGTSGRMSSPRASAVGRAAGTARSSNAGAVAGGGVAGGAGTTGVETVAEEGDEAAAVVPDFLLKMQRLIQTEKNAKEIKIAEDSRKKIIFITARAHGGETASSWMCEGVIKFLLGDSPTAVELRKAAIFYIIPMLNIDGVVNGFSKRDICGSDLNENWESPSITLHSTLYHTKLLIKQAQASGALFAFFDLHAQAVKDGVAFYSVMPPLTEMQQYYQKVTKLHHQDEKKDIKPTTAAAAASSSALPVSGVLDITKQADPRNYNLAAARRSPLVNLKCCAVKAGAHKAGSARVVAANEFRFPISMTVEASFHLSLTHKKHTAKQLVSSDYARLVWKLLRYFIICAFLHFYFHCFENQFNLCLKILFAFYFGAGLGAFCALRWQM